MQNILVFPFDGIAPAVQNQVAVTYQSLCHCYAQQIDAVSMEFQL